MIGKRLKTANKKAKKIEKRYRRWGVVWPLGKYRKNNVTCSCWMCGNPRRYFSGENKLTMQERIAEINEREMIAAIAQR